MENQLLARRACDEEGRLPAERVLCSRGERCDRKAVPCDGAVPAGGVHSEDDKVRSYYNAKAEFKSEKTAVIKMPPKTDLGFAGFDPCM